MIFQSSLKDPVQALLAGQGVDCRDMVYTERDYRLYNLLAGNAMTSSVLGACVMGLTLTFLAKDAEGRFLACMASVCPNSEYAVSLAETEQRDPNPAFHASVCKEWFWLDSCLCPILWFHYLWVPTFCDLFPLVNSFQTSELFPLRPLMPLDASMGSESDSSSSCDYESSSSSTSDGEDGEVGEETPTGNPVLPM